MFPTQLGACLATPTALPDGPSAGDFYEFFAGGGMARAGLGPSWKCLFANDIDEKKAASYSRNWGDGELVLADVGTLNSEDLPGSADLAWASFPCQDLSLAGMGAGLKGARSGSFWPFWRLMQQLQQTRKNPNIIVLENVCGALTSHDGADFRALITALTETGYRCGALVIDAVHFVPQSRPRLFIVAVSDEVKLPSGLTGKVPDAAWTPAALLKACDSLEEQQRKRWLWWNLPKPELRQSLFSELIEEEPSQVAWHTRAETKKLLDMMSPLNRKKLLEAKRAGRRVVGAVYKRTRLDEAGVRQVRAEIRFDDIAGCLRTPVGGSSRQLIVVVEGEKVRSRLLSPREAARLMGLPEKYVLPQKYNEAYHLAGDGLVVPVVRHIARHILEPLVRAIRAGRQEAA
ncbi:DNA cytosine methyltransferase [Granulicella rosea]|uniref:DNA cytosine methyltransferase n=1 Tax=Granulicella rosea TaxID=474952 RepID=UPI001C3CFC97|nr:DNA cytosine methyltransferase [Granulicella rosea]